ncbi:PIN domain-containing protein [Microbacterium sp. ZOR0019]|uniref:PIN domain-containing protein n=1 Tax=Microbacterium sp. ZOR0019 TaxID=1339233 RepID=UPI0006472794|nr:PIN domain-containing protein [Microbacterium sp. ZOR0019]
MVAAAGQIAVFLDTTEFSANSSLESAGWDSLQAAITSGLVVVAVSEVTVRELTRQIMKKADDERAAIEKSIAALAAHSIEATLNSRLADDIEGALRGRLARRKVQVLPLPEVSHDELIGRDLAIRKPFDKDGKGYRDALIWQTFVCWARQSLAAVGASEIYFVSRNVRDFAFEGALHPDLAVDVPADIVVQFTHQLSSIVARVREIRTPSVNPPASEDEPAAPSAAGAAGLAVFEGLAGQAWEDLGGFPFTFSSIETVMVVAVDIARESLEATLVDTIDGVGIWDVRVGATLTLEGMVYRGDASVLDGEWSVSYGDFDDHYHEATRTIQSTLVADVRIAREGAEVDAALSSILVSREQVAK